MKTIMTLSMPAVAAVVGLAWTPAAPVSFESPTSVAEFPHASHVALMPSCSACHSGVSQGNMYPDASFCGTCHNGSIQPAVDWRPPVASQQGNPRFSHGTHIAAVGNECADCHVEGGSTDNLVQRAVVEQCQECHSNSPELKTTTVWHGDNWTAQHQLQAAASPETCVGCHVRADCLECHRPNPATSSPAYHGPNFVQNHATWSYNRESSCSDCHNSTQFCVTCHNDAGLTSTDGIGDTRYHDAKTNFTTGHGQAARQSLESCVACHSQTDCLACHTATGSGRFNPHGPGWDAAKMRSKNPSMCAVCHPG